MGSRNCTLVLNLMEGSKPMGKAVVRAESTTGSNEVYTMKFEGNNLGKSYFCFKERPFFTICKKMIRQSIVGNDERQRLINSGDEEEWLKVYESELGKGSTVYFNQAVISSSKFCSKDIDSILRVGSTYLVQTVRITDVLQLHVQRRVLNESKTTDAC